MSADVAAGKGGGSSLLALARNAGVWLGLVLAVAGVAALALGPLLYRSGVWSLDMATQGVGDIAKFILLAGLVMSLIGLAGAVATKKQRSGIAAVVLITATAYGFGRLYSEDEVRSNLPPIYDVQTDWSMPVAFTEKTLADREKAGAAKVRDDAVIPPSGGKWAGKTVAAIGAEAYDLEPLKVRATPAQATDTATTAAKRMGWAVTTSDPATGQVEAVSTSPWYGLVSDIAVRITPDGQGARVDVRATSRTPQHDMGSNAALVKDLIDEIALELR